MKAMIVVVLLLSGLHVTVRLRFIQLRRLGHAVRAGYQYAGMADVSALTGDMSYARAAELEPDDGRRHGLVHWLLLNKKLNHWKSTRATAEVIYALVRYLSAEDALEARQAAQVTGPAYFPSGLNWRDCSCVVRSTVDFGPS